MTPLPWPRSIVGAIYAMARPARPVSEAAAVREAASMMTGSDAARAQRIAGRVAALALAEVDGDPAARIAALVRALPMDALYTLATCPEIDTGALIRRERVRRLEANGGRRSLEAEWPAEDRAVLARVTAALAARYVRQLAQK